MLIVSLTRSSHSHPETYILVTQQHTHRFSQIKPVPNNHIEHQLFQPLYQYQRHLLSSSCSHTNTSSTNDPLSPPKKKTEDKGNVY